MLELTRSSEILRVYDETMFFSLFENKEMRNHWILTLLLTVSICSQANAESFEDRIAASERLGIATGGVTPCYNEGYVAKITVVKAEEIHAIHKRSEAAGTLSARTATAFFNAYDAAKNDTTGISGEYCIAVEQMVDLTYAYALKKKN